jgi:hypothetical protein
MTDREAAMWMWDGCRWYFFSLAGPWLPMFGPPELSPPKHEEPIAALEYVKRIKRECD